MKDFGPRAMQVGQVVHRVLYVSKVQFLHSVIVIGGLCHVCI